MADLNTVLAERGKEYGEFHGHAAIAQHFKRIAALHLATQSKVLADDQQEAMEMVFHKLARIINGNADNIDSWLDIAGYTTLVANRLAALDATRNGGDHA
jgi:hypothetical protein